MKRDGSPTCLSLGQAEEALVTEPRQDPALNEQHGLLHLGLVKHENGLSSRQIAASLGISKGAVEDYLQRAGAAGLNWPLPKDLTDTALERLLFPGPPKPTWAPRPEPNWAYIDQELRRTGVTRSLLWQEYRAQHPDGYGYAWFCEHYDACEGRVSLTMRQTHAAGEKVFVDNAGDTVDVIDPPRAPFNL